MKVAIIGAGPAGLALAKQLQQLKISFVVYERDEDLGGVWNINNQHSVMYHSAHTISSKTKTEFSEFPMPETYPDYPSHRMMLDYLKNYAEKFDLAKNIYFGTKVVHLSKSDEGKYQIGFENGDSQVFDYVAIATGHTSKPRYPDLNFKKFQGQVIHSQAYKEPSIFKNKKVLIIGAGNTGCDIACEATKVAKAVYLSMRRGYFFIPKFIFGMPADVFGETSVKLKLPMFVRQWLNQLILRVYQGNLQNLGFPPITHKIFESHPIVNELLLYYVRHGLIGICADVKQCKANHVFLVDNQEIDVDYIVIATGYEPDFSFLEDSLQPSVSDLHLNCFSKRHYGLFFLGFIDPNGGVLGLIEDQAIAVAKAISLQISPKKFLSLIQKNVSLNGGINYLPTIRHQFEVELNIYQNQIKKQIQKIDQLTH